MSAPASIEPPTTPAVNEDQATSATIIGPADELLDPQRLKVIQELRRHRILPLVNSATWACLWFADMESLKRLLKDVSTQSEGVKKIVRRYFEDGMRKFAVQISDTTSGAGRPVHPAAIRNWREPKAETGAPSTDDEPPSKKQRCTSAASSCSSSQTVLAESLIDHDLTVSGSLANAQEQCMERDRKTCLLTGYREPVNVAYIYPESLSQPEKNAERAVLSNSLGTFWSEEKFESWEKQVAGPHKKDSCSSMLCMSNLAHELWKKARFALRPVSLSEDKTILTAQFFWLPRNTYIHEMEPTETPKPFPSGLSASMQNGQVKAKLFDIGTGEELCSGDTLTFTTDDPVARPLPSMELLDMQWILHRVLALSGVTDATHDELNPTTPWYEEEFDEKEWEWYH